MPRTRVRSVRRLETGIAALAFCTACSGSPSPAQPPPESRVEPQVLTHPTPPRDGSVGIATIFPAAGRYASSGIQSLNGARLAIEDLNDGGGIHGRRVTLLEYRTGSYFLDAREAARRAAADGALAIVGSNSSDLSMAIAEEAEARHLVQISNVSTAQDLTWDPATGRSRAYVFRVCATDVAMGRLLATFARDTLGARRAAVLYEVGRTYSARMARSFLEHFRDAAAGSLAAEFFYLTLETDFRDQLRAVKAFAPDVVFLPASFTDATLIAEQAKGLGLEATLLGADGWSNPLLFKLGGPATPAYFVDHCQPTPAFSERYRRVFGQPAQGCRAALAYDAVRAVAAGLEEVVPRTGPGLPLADARQKLRDAVAGLDFEGVTGRVRFDRFGDRRIGVAVEEVLPRPPGLPETRLRGWVGER
jgi:branched-chain amino acid transport system substrate-binding protein